MRNLRSEQEIMKAWKGDPSKPLVSIHCMAFNHEPYINDALEGFLIQETDFPFEILIHDDASKDKTAYIIKEYEEKYPKIIKPIYQKENQWSKGNKPGELNKERAIGKYIAYCEGDDFWSAPNKLQKQINFLEKNTDYVMCFHNATVKDMAEKKIYDFNDKNPVFNPKHLNSDREVKGLEMLNNWIVPTASVVALSKYSIPKKNIKTYYGDIVLFLHLSICGKVFYFHDKLCVYRKLPQGMRTIYKKDIDGFIRHFNELQINFKEILGLDSICEKYKAIQYFLKGYQDIKKGDMRSSIKNFRMYFSTVCKFIVLNKPLSSIQGVLFIIKNCIRRVLS